jgi:UTP--glucose-1-phosphate uridylyltransferase
VSADLVRAFEKARRAQLSVLEVNGPDVSQYGVVKLGAQPGLVAGLVEKQTVGDAPSNLASIGAMSCRPIFLKSSGCRRLASVVKSNWLTLLT